MHATKATQPVLVVGAGLVGSLLAVQLARRGYRVRLLERRADMRKESISAGRSINLAVSVRGLHALKSLGLEEEVLRQAVPMPGRMIHAVDGALTFQRYGKDDSECINSVSRGALNRLLLSAAEKTGQVELLFNQRAVAVDLDAARVEVKDERTGATRRIDSSCVMGTDGSASIIRDEIIRRTGASCTHETLDYGYKELTIPAGPAGAFRLEKNALHIWPRGIYMLIALPNLDGSFTCTLFLPHQGPVSFEGLNQIEQVRALFTEQFPDIVPLIPGLEAAFFENPTGRMTTVKCGAWHYRDRALLLGDAAHAIVPFFGQGMNCGFEDCTILDELLSTAGPAAGKVPEHFDEVLFGKLERARKPNADAIADLAVENFLEMRDKVGNPRFLMEKGVERILQQAFPGEYVSRYSLVSFSRVPYRLAFELGIVQSAVLAELCENITTPEQVDLGRAELLIRTRLVPLLKERV